MFLLRPFQILGRLRVYWAGDGGGYPFSNEERSVYLRHGGRPGPRRDFPQVFIVDRIDGMQIVEIGGGQE